MLRMGNHIHTAILREISNIAEFCPSDRQKPIMIVEEIVSDDWASATFVGATHCFSLRIKGDEAAVAAAISRIAETLPDHEIDIAGQIVADVTVVRGSKHSIADNMIANTLTVNVLTIID